MTTRKSHKARGATLESRLLSKRKITSSGCWEFTGYIMKTGYGQIGIGAREEGLLTTHRASYITFIGPIPEGKMVLHKCDNRPCFNPEHLFIGTAKDNNLDMYAKGRQPIQQGENCSNARLSNESVAQIRASYVPAKKIGRGYKSNANELAEKYGVSKGYIRDIISRKWRAVV